MCGCEPGYTCAQHRTWGNQSPGWAAWLEPEDGESDWELTVIERDENSARSVTDDDR